MQFHIKVVQEKPCNKCKRTLAWSEYNKASRRRDGLQTRCRDCSRIEAAARRARRRASGGDARKCKACLTNQPVEQFSRNRLFPDGIDDICRHCRPLLLRERGIDRNWMDELDLTNVEVKTLRLIRATRKTAKRQRLEYSLDWSFYLDNLYKMRRRKGLISLPLAVTRIRQDAGFIDGNCRVTRR